MQQYLIYLVWFVICSKRVSKRAVVSNDEVLAMQCYLRNILNIEEKRLAVGDVLKVPLSDEYAEVLNIQGKNAWPVCKN